MSVSVYMCVMWCSLGMDGGLGVSGVGVYMCVCVCVCVCVFACVK